MWCAEAKSVSLWSVWVSETSRCEAFIGGDELCDAPVFIEVAWVRFTDFSISFTEKSGKTWGMEGPPKQI